MDSHSYDGFYLEDLKVGQTAQFAKTITESDINLFAGITGDFNPVHVNREYAHDTMFKGRIAHGMLTASFISTVLGTKLPGPGCIYIYQNCTFKAPVRAGETAHARVTIKHIDADKKRVTLETTVYVNDKPVIEGEAQVMVPLRPKGVKKNGGAKKPAAPKAPAAAAK